MRNLKIITLASISLIPVICVSEANAQNFSTGINPSVIKIEANSPSTVRAPIQLENTSDQTITYSIFLRPFKAGSSLNGEPEYDTSLNDNYAEFFKTVSLTDLDKSLSEITLSPKQKKNLNLKIQISEETKKQDYYFTAIFLSQTASSEAKTTSVLNRGGIGTNILLSVGSKEDPEGTISKFTIPRFLTQGPVGFELEIANLNDYYVTSKGNIVIKNIFGQAVGIIPIKPTNILANSSREISKSNENKLIWNEKFIIGIYKAELNVAISDKGPIINQSKIFIAIPFKEIFVVIAIISLIIWIYSSAKRKNQLK